MKKRISILLLCVVMIFALAACSSAPKEVSLDVNQVAQKLLSDGTFEDQMQPLEKAAALKLYDLQESDVTAECVYVGTGATPEEISVWQASSADTVKTIEAAAKDRIEVQKKSFESYRPEQMPKLDSPVLVTSGNYVIFCISGDNTSAQSIVDSFLK